MKPEDYIAVDKALEGAFQRSEIRFNAYSVAYWAAISDIWSVNEYLLSKNGMQLRARIEFICPECGNPTASIPFGARIPDEVECHVCTEMFPPSMEFSNIVFSFNKADVEEKKTNFPDILHTNQTIYNHDWYQPVRH